MNSCRSEERKKKGHGMDTEVCHMLNSMNPCLSQSSRYSSQTWWGHDSQGRRPWQTPEGVVSCRIPHGPHCQDGAAAGLPQHGPGYLLSRPVQPHLPVSLQTRASWHLEACADTPHRATVPPAPSQPLKNSCSTLVCHGNQFFL